VDNDEFIHIIEELQDKFDDEEFFILAVVARNLWLKMNTVVFVGIFNHHNLIVKKMLDSINEFKTANARPQSESECSLFIQKWKALAVDFVKINWMQR
jgi:hypothetical protein